MKSYIFSLFGLISVIWTVIWTIHVIKLHKTRKNKSIPSLMLMTIGIFFSVWTFLMPAYYLSYDFGDGYSYIRPMMLSVFYAIKMFLMDGEYSYIIDAVADLPEAIRVSYTLYGAILLVIAPILTFSNVFFFFKNFNNEIKFNLCKYRPIYIMSELNAKSVMIAQSILEISKDKPFIVFANVSQQDEEEKYNLYYEIKSFHAISLRMNVLNLDISNKKKSVEYFLVGDDESDNVSLACALTRKLNESVPNLPIKVFAFAQNENYSYILDSLNYEHLLENAFQKQEGDYSFKLRRVDSKRQLVWNEVQKMNILQRAQDKVISILIVGFGSYGLEFFKMLFWYCQVYGYRLEFNIVDKNGTLNDSSIESMLNRNCPEILKYCERYDDKDMNYSVKCFSGVDLKNNTFRELMEYDGEDLEKKDIANRLKRVSTIIVTTGNDDLNIEFSVYLRTLYEKIRRISGNETDSPYISTVIYDEDKFPQGEEYYLINHEGIPYSINVFGNFSTQYSYSNIYDADLEKEAMIAHNKWVLQKNDNEALHQNIRKFERFEYFRLSSLASGIHKREMELNFADSTEDDDFRQRSEHMRWNAYMMVNGYEYFSVRDDRAKLHNKIMPRHKLVEGEKKKGHK